MSTYTFSAITTDDKTIEITSNAPWSCKAEGNFMLSNYCGSGNTSIDIIMPDDSNLSEGNVYFTYGDNACGTVNVNVYNTDDYVIYTNPSYEICDGKKTISFIYTDPKEAFFVDIESYGEWEVISPSGAGYITYKNGAMIIAPENVDEATVMLKPKVDEGVTVDDKYVIYIKLYKKQAV